MSGELGVFVDPKSRWRYREADPEGQGRPALPGRDPGPRPSPACGPNGLGVELRQSRAICKGEGAAAVRPAFLERGRHQSAGTDVLLVRAQYVSGEQPAQVPGRLDRRWASRSTSPTIDMPAYRLTHRAKTTSCRGISAFGSTQHPGPEQGQGQGASHSAPPGISPGRSTRRKRTSAATGWRRSR